VHHSLMLIFERIERIGMIPANKESMLAPYGCLFTLRGYMAALSILMTSFIA